MEVKQFKRLVLDNRHAVEEGTVVKAFERPIFERPTQPRIDGHCETLFWPVKYRFRHIPVRESTQQVLALAAAHFPCERQLHGPLDKVLVEQWVSRLK